MQLGYKLMSEEVGPCALVENAARAEEAGFEFAAISDHYFPWLDEQGHAPFIWSVLGSIATRTHRLGLLTAVTCPIFRYHPAVVAQAAATIGVMADGRFRLGLGSGERLNEHVIGGGWPSVDVRQERLEEAIDIIRLLFSGEMCSYRGSHFELDDARLFDLPESPLEIVLAAGGPRAARLAGEKADGLVTTEPSEGLVEAYREAGGKGPRYAEISLCWAESEEEAVDTMHRFSRWSGFGWSVLAELATPRAFESVAKSVRPEDVAEKSPHGPDVEDYVAAAAPYVAAGYDHLILHQIGPEQTGFFRFFERELRSALRELDETG